VVAEQQCHSCGGERLQSFYEVRDIPVHSCLLMSTARQAVDYPRGNLRLGFCHECGFIQNLLFDPGVHEYSTRYEETQSASPTFNEFARGLAQHLIDRYGLRDKHVLEIGCGKGEFLVLLSELGGNRGTGLDPGYRPERTHSESAARLTFIQDFYSEEYAELTADLIYCRHTLEHIAATRELVRLVADAAARREGCVVFFEVPDVARVLRERAFWDIYYEHCSYFSAGSLARIFRACGLEILDLATAFADQYLLIEARSGDGTSGSRFALEEPQEELARLAGDFERDVEVALREWRDQLERWRSGGKRVALWGSGSKAVSFLTTLGVGDQVGLVVDINPHRQGKFMPGTGHEIVAPAAMKDYRPDVVVIMNPIYRDEIDAELRSLGCRTELATVDCPSARE
jgi:SAM-dependent methyltransferase